MTFTTKMTACGALLLAGTAAVLASGQSEPNQTAASGYMMTNFDAAHRDAPVEVHVWYPTEATGIGETIAQNILFDGFFGQIDAAPTQTAHPVIVFSHGSGGRSVQTGWLASQLAAQGYIVVAPHHQGTMTLDSDPHQTPMLWQRVRDISAALDMLEAGELGGIKADMTQVAAMGFSLGGAAALSISGAGLSKSDFIAYCAQPVEKPDCDWMNAAGVDFSQIDQTLYESDWSDPRIDAVFAIDPALTQAMTDETLATMDMPVLTLGLGNQDAIPVAVDASHLTGKIAGAEHVWIPGGAHFSFLPSCGYIGKIATGVMGDDNICSDWGLRNRDVLHAEIADQATAFFAKVFPTAL